MDSGVLLARQAIYDRKLAIYGWELLFRSHDANSAVIDDGDSATSSVLLNAFTSMPIADILEGKPAFVNFTRKLLDFTPPVGTSQLVVEILETVPINADTIAAIARLKDQGYTIALDDYVYVEGHHELLALADIIKIDVLAHPPEMLPELVAQFRPLGKRLLAEKVETMAMYELCRDLDFSLFQGYFLARPELIKGRALNGDQRTVLQLIRLLRSEAVEFDDIERIIQTDSVLTYRMLRMVNSAYFSLPREITSIRQALTLLGLDRLRSWAQLLALSKLENMPAGLYVTAMVRARMGELMAIRGTYAGADKAGQFTIGLLSTLDAFLGMDLPSILKTIELAPSVSAALLTHEGPAGLILATSELYERAEFDKIDWQGLAEMGLTPESIRSLYVESLQWAGEILAFIR